MPDAYEGMPGSEGAAAEQPFTAGFSDDFNKVKSDLAQLKNDIADLMGSLMDAGRSQAQSAGQKLGTMAQQRMGQLKGAMGDARGKSAGAAQAVGTKIQEQPLIALGAALAVGVIIGSMLHRD